MLAEIEPRRASRTCYERLEAEFIASTWWVPETFPVAAARLEALDLSTLHGGFGSDLLLADATFYELPPRDATASAAIALARRSLVSGELVASGALGFQFAGVLARRDGPASTRRSPRYDAAPTTRPSAAATAARGSVAHVPRARPSCCAATSTLALDELRDALERITALRIDTAFPYAVSFLAEALLERGEPAEAQAVLARSGCWTSCR